MSAGNTFKSFEEFWPFYIGEHRHPTCRRLHVVGTSVGLGIIATAAITANPLLLLAAPVVGYSCSWFGHFVIEGNRPATFSHPWWSLRGDLRMCRLALMGKMDAEMITHYGSTQPPLDS